MGILFISVMLKQIVKDLPYIAIGITMMTVTIVGNTVLDIVDAVDDTFNHGVK